MSQPPEPKRINLTIIPDEDDTAPRTYSNYCAIAHTPFDFTLTFCEVMPLSERDVQATREDQTIRAPVRARIVVPVQFVPTLVAALQEHMRRFSESSTPTTWTKSNPVH